MILLSNRTRFTARLLRSILAALLLGGPATAQRYLPDDPMWQEPPPVPVGAVESQELLNLVDFYKNTVYEKGERHRPGNVIPSAGVNTLGEVPDSAWYTNRRRGGRMSLEQLVRGPNMTGPPSPSGRWTVIAAKAEGVTPGFTIEDTEGKRYLLKFDPVTNPELASGADAVSPKFFYAAGYNVPENYIVRFRREQLVVGKDVEFLDRWRRKRVLKDRDIDAMLDAVPVYEDGTYRGLASLYLQGELVGPFKYYDWREDDPNEIAPHEHLRVLRGLFVFAAWLNHTDAKALNSLDVVVEEEGRRFIRHYLIDFGATLGSDSLYAKDARLGHEHFIAGRPGLIQLVTFGLRVPGYARVRFPDDPAAGNFSSDLFDPDEWKTNYPNAAFKNRLPGDEFWAAKQVMAFTDEEIRAIVATGNYSNPATVEILSGVLRRRRDAIGRTFFAKLLPLDGFRVEKNRLMFDDLAAKYGFRPPGTYNVTWSAFDNRHPSQSAPSIGTGAELPKEAMSAKPGSYWAARIEDPSRQQRATVVLRRERSAWTVVGIEREGENAWRPR